MRGTLRTSDEAGVSGVLPPLLFRWREGFGKFGTFDLEIQILQMMSFLFDRVSLKHQKRRRRQSGCLQIPPKFARDLLVGTKSHRLGGPNFLLRNL